MVFREGSSGSSLGLRVACGAPKFECQGFTRQPKSENVHI